MPKLGRWLSREVAREERAVYLEDALLIGRFAAYARYRLRYFLGRFAVDALIHLIEFAFLSFIFEQRALVAALMVRVSGNFLSACWWGALESMRGEVREVFRDGKSHLVSKVAAGWLNVALVGAVLSLAFTTGWVVLDTMRVSKDFEVFHLYVFAVGLRFSLGLLAQTFHSAVYAIRRIYRPFLAIVGVELGGFIVTLLIWPGFGVWSFPMVMIGVGALANALTFVYVSRIHRFLGLPPLRFTFHPGRTPRRAARINPQVVLAGLSHALTRLDSVLVLALYSGAYRDPEGYRLFVFFYLIGPLVRAAHTWAQLFYFDLKRMELDLFIHLKERFARCIRRVAIVMGALFWVLACLVGTLSFQRNLGILYGLMLIFFMIRSLLAFHQVRAFTERRYGLLAFTGLVMIAGVWFARSLSSSGEERFALFVMVVPTALLGMGAGSLFTGRGGRRARMLSLPDWLECLCRAPFPVRLRVACFSDHADEWIANRIARKILGLLEASGAMAQIDRRRFAWYEADRNGHAPGDGAILQQGGGWIEAIRSSPYSANGQQAILFAQTSGLLEGVLNQGAPAPGSAGDPRELKREFAARFPDGVIYDATARDPTPSDGLSRRDRRQLMTGAILYSMNLFRRVRKARFDVTTFCQRGSIRLIFGIPETRSLTERQEWRSFITKLNVFHAINANHLPRREKIMSWIPFRQTIASVLALIVTALVLTFFHIDDRVTGPFLLKTQEQIKIYAPVAGFVKSLECREGDLLAAGSTLAQLEIPDLTSRMTQKRAEVKEAEAMLRLLVCGTRPEELVEQGRRVLRAQAWRDKSRKELKVALEEDKQQIANKVEQYRSELEFAHQSFDRSRELFASRVLSGEALEHAEKEFQVKQAQIAQAIAEQSARQASIILHAESELVDLDRELAEARATLSLMEAGTRPEVVEAKRAEVERLRAELAYLERLEVEQSIKCPIDGVVATPDLETLSGAYLREGRSPL
jgi:multidrug efflux pump subunit AcrA (membrane-fusion protein)